MRRMNFTYGQLAEFLFSLGFTSRLIGGVPPALIYDHKETGCSIMVPPFPKEDKMLEYHFANVRMMLDQFGIVERESFDAMIPKDEIKSVRRPSTSPASRSVHRRPSKTNRNRAEA
jgi:hypothetical protein